MSNNRGVLNAEHSLGWTFSKGMSRGGLGEYGHDRLIAEVVQGVDLIKQKALALDHQAVRTSPEIATASDALFEQLGARIWLGRADKAKPAWVADAGPTVCGGLYKRDLCFEDPQDHERLKALFHRMVLAKCRAFRQNRKQKERPRGPSVSYPDSAAGESKSGDGNDDEDEESFWQAEGGQDAASDDVDMTWQSARDSSRFPLEPHRPPWISGSSRPGGEYGTGSSPGPMDSNARSRGSDGSRRSLASRHRQQYDHRSREDEDRAYWNQAHASLPPARTPLALDAVSVSQTHWNAPFSPSDEQRLSQLSLRPLDPREVESRDAVLDLLRRIDLEFQHPRAGLVYVNLARCISREALFKRVDESVRAKMEETSVPPNAVHVGALEDEVTDITFVVDKDNDVPDELCRINLKRGGFRDQYPAFLHCLRCIDNGLDTYSLLANARTRSGPGRTV